MAHSALAELENDGARSSDRERFVEEAILGEAFANTVEILESMVQERPLYDTLFYGLNSYMLPKTKNIEALTGANSEFGSRDRFALLFLSFFESNLFAGGVLDPATYDRILGAWGGERTPVVKQIMKIGFSLNKYFAAIRRLHGSKFWGT